MDWFMGVVVAVVIGGVGATLIYVAVRYVNGGGSGQSRGPDDE